MRNINKIKNIGSFKKEFTNFSNETQNTLIDKVPVKIKVKLYCKSCTPEQLRALFAEWQQRGKTNLITRCLKKLSSMPKRKNIYVELNESYSKI